MWPSVESDKPIVRGERVGEATLLVRYQGKFGAIPVTVLNPKPGFVWKPLPQHNYIDRLVDAKLERLKIQPSPVTDDATVSAPACRSISPDACLHRRVSEPSWTIPRRRA